MGIGESLSREMKASRGQEKGDVLAAVDDDVLWHNAFFEHSPFRMVSSSSEQSRGLNAEIADLLPVMVDHAEAVLLDDLLILLFDFQFPFFAHRFAFLRFQLEIIVYFVEIALLEVAQQFLLLGVHHLR